LSTALDFGGKFPMFTLIIDLDDIEYPPITAVFPDATASEYFYSYFTLSSILENKL
jgi:hypothetical protein